MAEIRFNYGDKFTQTSDSNTGIGSTIPAGKLDVAGGTSAGSLRVSGIATLSSYQGFVNTKLNIPTEGMIVEAGQSGSVSGEVVIGTGQTTSVSTGATTGQGGVDSLKVSKTFMPPVGGTADRPTDVKPGMVYYNKDFKTIEFWDGNFWKQVDNTTRRGRGLFAGGRNSSSSDQTAIAFIEIASTGNAQSFGDLATARMWAGGASNAIRGLFSSGTPTTNMDYVTIASAGDGTTFGTCNQTGGAGSLASSTRALFGGGYSNTVNAIQFVEIMTLGNSIDFGDLRSRQNFQYIAAASNTTRGFFMGNSDASTNQSADVDFVTIASKGDSVKFTTLTQKRGQSASFSNSTRAVQACGNIGPNANTHTNTIDFISMSSGGNAIDFGDARDKAGQLKTGAASPTRGCFAGGTTDGSNALNNISFIQFSTTGDAQDFGDLSMGGRRNGMGGLSDSHGGLGGF
tara:strand:+ start:17460 stop:18830 length:1371 start_codon:yes stop_codon:yes gene_type:complete